MKCKISVCLTVYGISPFLEEQFKSILNQSYDDFEIIVFEDKHPSESAEELIKSMIDDCDKHDLNFTYVSSDFNVGPAVGFSRAIEKSSGDLLVFSDHDDIWNENKLSVLACKFHGDVKAIYHNGIVFGSDNEFKDNNVLYSEQKKLSLINVFLSNFIIGASFAVDGKLAREYVRKYSFKPMHDWVLVFLLILHNKKIIFIDDNLFFYRRHAGTVTGQRSNLIQRCVNVIKYRFFLVKLFVEASCR